MHFPSADSRWAISLTLGCMLALPGSRAIAADEAMPMDHSHHHGMSAGEHAEAADPHAAHRHMMEATGNAATSRSQVVYSVPDLRVVREDGKSVNLRSEVDDGRPVYLNFIFTTCTTICPMSSQVFSQLQQKLGDGAHVHLVSVSIDPEQDTPARLREYAAKFHAGASWTHYTGSLETSIAIQRAFAAYQGDKMNHTPLTLYRAAPGQPWVRLDGFSSADELVAEYRPAAAHH